MAGSVYTKGENRFAFGIIDSDGKAIYGPSAIYVAPAPNQPAQGPFAAPADVLLTQARYRSKQAATETDPFAAIYAAQVKFSAPGTWAVLVMTRSGGRLVGAPMRIQVKTKAQDTIPDVGESAPKVATDTLESLKGDKDLLDTRDPKTDMHSNFADAVGKKPVALLFATPQLCVSRVCGPVADIALQMKAKYGKRMTFIHQEVWADNQLNSALRPPLQAFHVETEPRGVRSSSTSRARSPRALKARSASARSRRRSSRLSSRGLSSIVPPASRTIDAGGHFTTDGIRTRGAGSGPGRAPDDDLARGPQRDDRRDLADHRAVLRRP